MIGIIDYGSGNIQAIVNIYNQLNIECKVIDNPAELDTADRLILPGVGSFDESMKQLVASGLKEKLDELVLVKQMPIMGICIGMQLMAESSEEGSIPGLGWIKGKVKKFDSATIKTKPFLPHMGWNDVTNPTNHVILSNIDLHHGFYFVHSYFFECASEENILSTCDYGTVFTCAVHDKNIFGMQFHPEKSHSNGITLLENFAKLDIC